MQALKLLNAEKEQRKYITSQALQEFIFLFLTKLFDFREFVSLEHYRTLRVNHHNNNNNDNNQQKVSVSEEEEYKSI